jgi:nucleoside-diphosphate-sugar epimerase
MTNQGGDSFLVTGANGFVGSEMVRLLRAQKIHARALVRSKSKGAELAALGAELVEGDLTQVESLARAMEGVRGVYHIGAVYRETTISNETFFKVNAEGTRNVFEAAISRGVSRVIHCSTGGVLGDIKGAPGSDVSPYAPEDVYQESKVEGEKIALEYYRSGKMGGAVIRPGMIYGPRDTRFLKLFKAIARRRFAHVGSGQQWVHYVDVRDLCQAFLLAMQHEELNGHIYCIAGATPVSFATFVDLVAENLGVRVPRWHVPLAPLQIAGSVCEWICKPFGISPPLYRRRVDFFKKNRIFDITKAQRELGYTPRQGLQEEVREVVSWYRGQGLV